MAKTYEMLWDCPFCGTKKLLGKTHRFCPSCGGAQDPKLRYFPSDAEKVAVEDHVYHGADKVCPGCQNPNSAAAEHCGSCGSPLAGAKDVARRQDQVGTAFAGETEKDARSERDAAKAAAAGQPPPPPPQGATSAQAAGRSKKSKKLLVAGGSILLLVLGFFILCGWQKETRVRVAGHAWTREIAIEKYGPVDESAWCDQMPRGAYDVSRSREVRSHRDVPDGEECATRRVDNGDGTFSEQQECHTRYRSEPVYDDHCHYTIDRWKHNRSEVASGASVTETPVWPTVRLGRQGSCIGCEREGPRSEKYVVNFVETEKGETHECSYPQSRWASLALNSEWMLDVAVVTSYADCDSLKPAP